MEDKWNGIPPILKKHIQNREMTKKQSLLIFLEEHGVYDDFYINVFKNQHESGFLEQLAWIEMQPTVARSIGSGFLWAGTLQGHNFWESLQGIAQKTIYKK